MKRFRLSYTMTADLAVEQLWPDGDAPANPTAQDVERLISRCGGWQRVLRSWNLDEEEGDGHVLEVGGDPPPADANEP
jgi:hypothetical protein